MNTRTRVPRLAVWAAALSTALLIGASPAWAGPFSQLVVFGDSLSDAGNAAAVTGNAFPPSPPYAGTFSNGPTAAQYLAQRIGVPVQLGWPTTSAASNNFAVGGAGNGTNNFNVDFNSPPGLGAAFPALVQSGIQRQIQRYGVAQGGLVPNASSTLFMVWGGPNDIFLGAQTGGNPAAYISASLAAMQNNLLSLVAMGAKHLLVPSMPNLGVTPDALASGPAFAAGVTQLSGAFNGGLDLILDGLAASLAPLGVQIYEFDVAAQVAEITLNASSYGFNNTTQGCLSNLSALPSCAGYAYFDGVHPTTAAHRLLAERFAGAVGVPTPGTLSLFCLAFAALLVSRRTACRRG